MLRRALPLTLAVLTVLTASGCRSLPRIRPACDVFIVGLDDRALRKELLAFSSAWQYRRDPGEHGAELEIHSRADASTMSRYLVTRGYCAATVTSSITTNGNRASIRFDVANTRRYRVRDVVIESGPGLRQDIAGWTNTLSGSAADFSRIDDAGRDILSALRNAGHPYATLDDKAVHLDHGHEQVDVHYRVTPGPKATFGQHSVEGLRRVDPRFVERRVTWRPGDPYRQHKVDTFGRRLTESGLFSYVGIQRPDAAPTSSVYDVAVQLKERKPQTLGLGVGYRSDIGPEASVLWQHRNLFGMGQRIELDAKYAEDLWLGAAILTLPDMFGTRHAVDFALQASEEDSDAYDVRYGLAYIRLQQYVGRRSTLHYGPALRQTSAQQLEEDEDYLQASFPLLFLWNRRNDALNPTRGFAVAGRVEPTQGLDEPDTYVATVLTPTAHVPLAGDDLVLSARLTLGSIAGSERDAIPPDLRFYAGGGQSIRGYAYQSVGPREEDQPVGGRSLVESSLEVRWRFTERLGSVVFLDGGSAYEPEISNFSETYQWGAGLGFRYFTAVGPIRADVGMPLNPREDIDNAVEFYISIGQAF